MSTQPSLIDRVLIDILTHPNQTAEQRAGRVGSNANGVHTACWTLRRQEFLDGDNKPTQTGIARCESFKAANDGATSSTEAAVPEKPRRGRPSGKKATKRAPPQVKTSAVVVPALPASPPTSRAEAVHRVADSVIANARNSHRVLRAYLDETVEITPLLESLLDNHAGSITLIEQTYHAAR